MAVVTSSWLVDSTLLLATLLYLLYRFFMSTANYFKDRGIPYLKPFPFIGEKRMFTDNQLDLTNYLYSCFPNERFFGFFQTKIPVLLVKDVDLVQRIVIKDFAHFHDRGFAVDNDDPLNKNLFNLKGHTWRVMRQKLIPTFTTGKLKQMFDQLNKCGDNLLEELEKVSASGDSVDTRKFIFGFSSEVIGSAAFGLDFRRSSPQAIEFNSFLLDMFKLTKRQLVVFFLILAAPKLKFLLGLRAFPKKIEVYFFNLIQASKEYRKKNNIKRNDYFQLLLSLQEAEESGKNVLTPAVEHNEEDALINQMDYVPQYTHHADPEEKLFTDMGVTAQAFVFLTAGTESVSGTLSFVLYHVGRDPELQNRLREEVTTALTHHGAWSYQAVKDMVYLDQVIQETQRLYPIVPLTMRECTIPYTIPESNYVIEKGAVVAIPVGAMQRDPKYYPDPEVFNPDRFTDNNHKPNPTFMPFGDGPRICIAMRFAILEMKVCVAKILSQYTVHVDTKTKEPFTFDQESFFPRPVGGIWLNFKKISPT